MMNDFSFQNTTRVHFGKNALSKLSSEVIRYGNKVLLVYGGTFLKKCGLYDKIVNELKKENIEIFDKISLAHSDDFSACFSSSSYMYLA